MELASRRSDSDQRSVDPAEYARRLGVIVAAAARSRALLLHELERVQRDEPDALARAGRIAGQCAEALDLARQQVRSLSAPPTARTCSTTLESWLGCHVAACDELTVAAGTHDARHVLRAVEELRGSASYARQFNQARQSLARSIEAG